MKDMSGTKWGDAPLFGAFGAGKSSELPATPDEFSLTPSAQEEVPDSEGFEQSREPRLA